MSGLFGLPNPFSSNKPPNPQPAGQVANRQLGYNEQVQGYNAVPQSGIFGQTNYTYDPTTGRLTSASTGLNGQGQQIESNLMGELGTSPHATSDAVYQQYTSRLDPQWQQNETAERDRLANSGIVEGSDAYNKAMEEFNRNKTDAYQMANNQAQVAGGQEQARVLNGLYGLGESSTAGYLGTPNVAPVNYGGYYYGGQLPAQQANQGVNQAGQNSMLNAATGLLGSYLQGGGTFGFGK